MFMGVRCFGAFGKRSANALLVLPQHYDNSHLIRHSSIGIPCRAVLYICVIVIALVVAPSVSLSLCIVVQRSVVL